jgi:hypothetical protein
MKKKPTKKKAKKISQTELDRRWRENGILPRGTSYAEESSCGNYLDFKTWTKPVKVIPW